MSVQYSVQRAKEKYRELLADASVLDDEEAAVLTRELKSILSEYVDIDGHALSKAREAS